MAFNLAESLKNLPKTLIKACSPEKKAGMTLLVINAMGMIFAALSNTYAAAADKNTSAEDKKFLVPAGLVTGVANIGLYYAMTVKIIDALQGKTKYNKDGSEEYVRGFADTVLDYMKKNRTKDGSKTLLEDAVSKFTEREIAKAGKNKRGLFSFGYKSPEGVKGAAEEFFTNQDNATKAFKNTFKSGFGVMGAFIGAVVGCAVLTPIIRDVSAYFVQKRMEKNNPEMKDKPYKPYFEPTRIESVRYGNIDAKAKKQPLSMKSYMAFTNGSMKI